jgi:Tfp pilus assembly protein PilN
MALRDVNLIATDILVRRFTFRHLFMWCGGLIAVAALMAGIYVYQTRIHAAAKRDLLNTGNPSAVLSILNGKIKKGQQELNIALQERTQLGAMTAMQRSYSSVMAKLAEIMNDQTWLQQLALEAGRDHTAHLKLAGSSVSHESLGDFMQRLSNDPLFRNVVLKSAQESETKSSGGSLVQFLIECDIPER